jgi:hypothetical protein
VLSWFNEGTRFCGKRGGASYLNAKRNTNEEIGGECPSGYQSCHTDSVPEPETTWCIPEGSSKSEECPITGIKIVQN